MSNFAATSSLAPSLKRIGVTHMGGERILTSRYCNLSIVHKLQFFFSSCCSSGMHSKQTEPLEE